MNENECVHPEKLEKLEVEKKLEEEDEALIRSLFQKPKEIVRRISDEDLDDDGDLFQLASESSEKSNNNLKKRKVSEEIPSKPTDSLTEDSVDSSSNRETPTDSGSQGDSKLPRKTPLVRISVIRKPTVASDTKVAAKSESKQLESTGLLSLCQNYDSDDE
ncbi:hypothetical protein Pint_04931 [Pistacia integerrima]|uniref:Uncharacterized protein n=1 Tax=Pistacia integerrima TaxID=434235 RepID=A0ACC0ZA44_9ROSI|nr:hypothetical protein Pint_04931 [Pistacia integerrima]